MYLPAAPRRSVPGGDYAEHHVVLGTHTSGTETNHLCIATVRLPTEDAEIDVRKYDEEKGGTSLALQMRVSAVARPLLTRTSPLLRMR